MLNEESDWAIIASMTGIERGKGRERRARGAPLARPSREHRALTRLIPQSLRLELLRKGEYQRNSSYHAQPHHIL